MDALT